SGTQLSTRLRFRVSSSIYRQSVRSTSAGIDLASRWPEIALSTGSSFEDQESGRHRARSATACGRSAEACNYTENSQRQGSKASVPVGLPEQVAGRAALG